MANYKITVNGRSYDVVVEKAGGSTAPKAAALTPAPILLLPLPHLCLCLLLQLLPHCPESGNPGWRWRHH